MSVDPALALGDMRALRLDKTFDAILMDDAISYMPRLADFVAAFRTAAIHLIPDGVLVATPDVTFNECTVFACVKTL